MAPPVDPYRTLGLGRDATLDQVKRAYRRLAKANHPDTAGEAAVPRFLAIKAAYEAIAGPGATDETRGRRRAPTPQRPWDADPSRADATRRAYGSRSRAPRSGARPARGPAPGAQPPPSSDGADAQERAPNLATPGSTSYDGMEGQPFEPDWGGASWYGTTSGTYWTLNPKEYADPRKHGPEYQARARRRREVAGPVVSEVVDGPLGAAPGEPPATAGDAAAAPPHTTESWSDATAGTAADLWAAETDRPASAAEGDRPPADPAAVPEPVPFDTALRDRWLRPRRYGHVERLVVAIIAWVPIVAGLGAWAGALDGCGARAAGCTAADLPLVSFIDLALLAALLIVPLLARLAAVGSIAVALVVIAASFVIPELGDQGAPGSIPIGLVVALAGAWLLGIVVAVVSELRRPPSPVS